MSAGHDVTVQTMTGTCWVCAEVACDPGCRGEGARRPGDATVLRKVLVNRATGHVFMLQREGRMPFPAPIAKLELHGGVRA